MSDHVFDQLDPEEEMGEMGELSPDDPRDETREDESKWDALREVADAFDPIYLLVPVIILVTIAAVLFGISELGWQHQTQVIVQVNIGQVLLGVLGGGGIAAAGTAYFYREMKRLRE